MCTPDYSLAREQDVIALIEIMLDLPQRDGACVAGVLMESAVGAQIILALSKWLASLKAKIHHVPIEQAERMAEAQITEMMASLLLRTQVEAELHRMRN